MSQVSNVYLIKDLSRLSGHSIHTLKFYLKRGLIQESGRSPETRFRYFNQTTIERLAAIRTFRKQQKSLAEIQQLLDGLSKSGSVSEVLGPGSVPTAHSPQPTTTRFG